MSVLIIYAAGYEKPDGWRKSSTPYGLAKFITMRRRLSNQKHTLGVVPGFARMGLLHQQRQPKELGKL
jgi:hypothetical protein